MFVALGERPAKSLVPISMGGKELAGCDLVTIVEEEGQIGTRLGEFRLDGKCPTVARHCLAELALVAERIAQIAKDFCAVRV